MFRLSHPLLLASILLYFGVYLLRYFNVNWPIINGYLTDFICVGLITYLCNYISNRFIFKTPNYIYPSWFTLFLVVYLSVVFEGILPLYSDQYTADPFDVVAYALGGVFYTTWINGMQRATPQ